MRQLAEWLDRNLRLTSLIALFFGLFWVLNGLDKFFHRTDFGAVTWWGKDRTEQFTDYFTHTELPLAWVSPVLWFTGLVELLVGLLFFAYLRGTQEALTAGIKTSLLVFIGFASADIIFGDRGELLEHSTYVALLILSLGAVRNAESATTANTRN